MIGDLIFIKPTYPEYTPPPTIFKWQRFPMQLRSVEWDDELVEWSVEIEVIYPGGDAYFSRLVTLGCGGDMPHFVYKPGGGIDLACMEKFCRLAQRVIWLSLGMRYER